MPASGPQFALSEKRPMSGIADNIIELIGGTPLVRLNKVSSPGCSVAVKLEGMNPNGSVKDRIGAAMLDAAEKEGLITPGVTTIVEATSGNTGIGLAMACVVRGYSMIFVMPDTMTIERRSLLLAFGAQLELTPGAEGMKGASARATEIVEKISNGFMPAQFDNPANPDIHVRTTGPEIWEDTEGHIDILVAGVGTGGTLTGTGSYLKSKNADIKVIAVEPAESAVLSGNDPGPHKIQGIGAGFVPEVLDTDLIDEIVCISQDDAFETTRRLCREEGIFVGISSGAITRAACEVAARPENAGRLIVAVLADFGERYLSNPVFSDWDQD